MITYNNIVNRFERFVEDNAFLKTFTHGSPSGVDLEKFEVYPALHLVYTGATYDSTSKTYSFEVYILDLPPDKARKIDNQTQLVSNAEQVAEDILADMMNGDNVFNFSDLYTVTSANSTPLEETTSNSLAGILLSISIEVGYTFDSCNAPLKGVTPSGSQIPSGGGGTISTINASGMAIPTTLSVGAVTLSFPYTTDLNFISVDLQKSLSWCLSGTLSRNELRGLNSTATVFLEYTLSIEADGAGVIALQDVSSPSSFGISETFSFTSAGTQEITLSGSITNESSDLVLTGLTVLSNVTGKASLKSFAFTINNQF